MKNWKRTLLIGLIWGYILIGWWAKIFFRTNWDLEIFELGHWQFLIDEYRKGWAISTTSDWLFVISLISVPLFYTIGLKFMLEIKWTNLLHKITNKIIYFLTGNSTPKHQVKVALNKNSSKNIRPKAMDSGLSRPISKNTELKLPVEEGEKMPSFAGMSAHHNMDFSQKPSDSFSSMGFGGDKGGFSFGEPSRNNFTPPVDNPFGSSFGTPSMKQGFSIAPNPTTEEDDFDRILLEDIKLPNREPLEENMPEILSTAGYQLIPNASLGDIKLDYLAVGKNKILACKIDPEEGDWLADEEKFNGEDPLWFSESSHRVSPIFDLIEQVNKFTERLKTFGYMGKAQPVFIVKNGSIINAEDMLSTWKELGVTVCRTDMGGPDELLSFEDSVLPDSTPDSETMIIVQNAL